jgi:hypothetical protein
MSADIHADSKPTISETTKSQSEHKPSDLKSEMVQIFNKGENQTPPETLQQLASQEIPQDSQQENNQIPETPPEIVVSIPDTTQVQAEIAQLTQTIQNLKEEPNPQSTEITLEAPFPQLFPDHPSLYDQYHKKYEAEKRTIKGALQRYRDVHQLKKEGLKDAKEIYDSFRARGIERRSITEILKEGRHTSYKELYGQKPLTIEEKNTLIKKAPDIIDRLDSINYQIDFSLENISTYQSILAIEDNQLFQQKCQQIQPLFFLDSYTAIKYLSNKNTNPKTDIFIKYLISDFVKTGNNPKENFSQLNNTIDSILNSDSFDRNNYYLDNFIKEAISSDLNPNKSIKLPDELISSDHYINEETILLNSLSDRRYQRFFLENNKKTDSNGNKLFKDNVPTINFYRQFFYSETNQGQKITISPETLNLIKDPVEKEYYQNISNLNSYDFQKTCLRLGKIYPEYFDSNGNPTGLFLFDYIKLTTNQSPKETLSQIPNEYLSKLSADDLTKFKLIKYIINLESNSNLNLIRNINFHWDKLSALCNEEGEPNSLFFTSVLKENVSEEQTEFIFNLIKNNHFDSFDVNDQHFWTGLFLLKSVDKDIRLHLVSLHEASKPIFKNGRIIENALETMFQKNILNPDFIYSNLTSDTISSFSKENNSFWTGIASLKKLDKSIIDTISGLESVYSHKDTKLFKKDGSPTSYLFLTLSSQEQLTKEFLQENIPTNMSENDLKIWNFVATTKYKLHYDLINLLYSNKNNLDKMLNNNELTQNFYQTIIEKFPQHFVNTFDKSVWKFMFGDELIDNLLKVLPEATKEKRNAFTHNEYDRTSEFFSFLLQNPETNFKLDPDNIKIASEYIKNYGLSKSVSFYSYFKTLYSYEQGTISTLPNELTENNITSLEALKKEIRNIQKKCFDNQPLINVQELSPFELSLLSVTTGHSTNRWSRIPIETVVSDFSKDMSEGLIAPLAPEFQPESINLSSISTESNQKISDSPKLESIKDEILNAMGQKNDIEQEKSIVVQSVQQKINELNKSENNNIYTQNQIEIFQQQLEIIKQSNDIDSLLIATIPLSQLGNSKTGNDSVDQEVSRQNLQENINSVLRQLVFRKVFQKHKESEWQKTLKNSLENQDTVNAVKGILGLINNTIKDHALNFESNNQDMYWNNSTFEKIKKYSSVFKKKLAFQPFVNELNLYQQSFIIKDLNQDQTVEIIPDRGLMGEMSGYMADVCYTKVYPLLKQYPNLTPYKFVVNPKSENPEFIGSTLVFNIDDADGQPVFLIRAFDIPNEQSVDVSKFFETFVDKLVLVAKKLGIKKILTAGTDGTISNYPGTVNYILKKYVKGKNYVPLKNTFDFNGTIHDITQECYQVRDLS